MSYLTYDDICRIDRSRKPITSTPHELTRHNECRYRGVRQCVPGPNRPHTVLSIHYTHLLIVPFQEVSSCDCDSGFRSVLSETTIYNWQGRS